jgi:hypothetical protein
VIARVVVVAALAAGAAQAQTFQRQTCTSSTCRCDAPRFLCNGVSADNNGGVIESDHCGNISSCTASTAAKWSPATVSYRYDKTTVPGSANGVSASQWTTVIANARQAWVNAANGGLSLSDGGNITAGRFFDFNGENAIFWITSSSEWQNATQSSAAGGTLGVTISDYGCISSTQRGRIRETDTVLNGVTCNGCPRWCGNANGTSCGSLTSVQGVLAHEMGHGLGLDHPAEFCQAALMSAFDSGVVFPQAVDVNGLLALYNIPPGGLGSPCSVNGDCNSGRCITVDGARFCSQTCSSSCPNGMNCEPVNGESMCIFAGLGARQIGDACTETSQCAGACTTTFDAGCNVCADECAKVCRPANNQGCAPTGEFCLAFRDPPDRGICVTGELVGKGQTCDDDSFCNPNQNLACVGNGTTGTCLALCNNQTGIGCSGPEQCYDLAGPGTQGACFPAGSGRTGAPCSDIEDCDVGFTCASDAVCRARCDMNFGTCGSNEQCVSNGLASFCRPGGVEGEGEGEEPPPPTGQCRISRGNFDCPADEGCVVSGNSKLGTCVRGENGETKTFNVCEEDDDCDSGLCVRGVCTRPCDEGRCPRGYDCDDTLAPPAEAGGEPGLCVPDSCRDDYSVCDRDKGFRCVYSPSSNYVCAKDGDPVGCQCGAGVDGRASAALGVLLLALLRVRRPHGRRRYTV